METSPLPEDLANPRVSRRDRAEAIAGIVAGVVLLVVLVTVVTLVTTHPWG